MTAGSSCFLDTNILIYAALGRAEEPEKWAICRQIVVETEYCTSAQILAEFYANAIKGQSQGKKRTPLPEGEARAWITALAKKPCQPITPQIVISGIDISQRYQTSYWDGAIIAAAAALGATTLYTEDLNNGQLYGSVRVVNPFL